MAGLVLKIGGAVLFSVCAQILLPEGGLRDCVQFALALLLLLILLEAALGWLRVL